MDSKNKIQFLRKVNDIYTYCCSGITKMPTLQSKRFCVRLALEIHSLQDWKVKLPALEPAQSVQYVQPAQPAKPQHDQSIQCPQQTLQPTLDSENIRQQSIATQTDQIFSSFFDKPTVNSAYQSEQSESEHQQCSEYGSDDSDSEDPELKSYVQKFDRIFAQRNKQRQINKLKENELNNQIQLLKKQILKIQGKLKVCEENQKQYHIKMADCQKNHVSYKHAPLENSNKINVVGEKQKMQKMKQMMMKAENNNKNKKENKENIQYCPVK